MSFFTGAALVVFSLACMTGMVVEAFRPDTKPLVRAWRALTVPIVVVAVFYGLCAYAMERLTDRLDEFELQLEAWSERS